MNYFFYFISFALSIFSFILFFKAKKANRFIHIIAYLFPFWVWGIFFLILSLIFWKLVLEKNNYIFIYFFQLSFIITGIILLFFPKRKIKKYIEKWEDLPQEIKKIHALILIILSFLIYSITF
jgi:hypothetical protein